VRNVRTYDLKFGVFKETKVPPDSKYVSNPPRPWSPAAVSAHANASVVADFIRDVLKRNGLDNQGSPFVSTVNCVEEPNTKVWDNAAWVGGIQIVYGQSDMGNGDLRSWAVALDMVAHEMTHGLSENTARLEYKGQSGALDESYADIFGVIVNNFEKPIAKWDWRIGKDVTADGQPLRDMKRPGKFQQPAHMDDYEKLPNDEFHDNGGVHTNSGIHNKVAYNVLTTKDSKGKFLFKAREVAAIFYIALTKYLSRTSRFSNSRRGVELAALSYFANDPKKSAKIKAVSKAFDKVGIYVETPS
jgi:bacillolysin/neutral peptidase B